MPYFSNYFEKKIELGFFPFQFFFFFFFLQNEKIIFQSYKSIHTSEMWDAS